jgi:hypothetical protein
MASAALSSVEYLRKVPGPFFNQSPNDGAALMKRFVEEANKYDFYREEWFRHRRSGFTTLITKIKSRVSVCKYMLTDIETYPGHPAPFTIPDQPIYAGHPLLPNTKSFDGFILGMITDPLQFDRQQGCTVGDGFVIGPNGTRCGLTWEVLDDGSQPGFATLEKANGAR